MRRYSLCLLFALAACGGGDGPGDPTQSPAPPPAPAPAPAPVACDVQSQRDSLRTFMQDEYFWYDRMGTPDAAAPDMDGYFGSLLNKPTDRYSYTQTSAAYNQVFAEGRRTGYGYTLSWADADRTWMRVRNVEPAGPVALAGLRRGDTILAIDGLSPAQIGDGLLPNVTTEGVARSFRVRGHDGTEREFTVLSADFPLTPVSAVTTFEVPRADGSTAKVGYMAYGQFIRLSQAAFSEAIQGFAEGGVDELVLDLRYNGGDSVAISQRLASLLGGARTANKIYTYLRYNPKQVSRNTRFMFLPAGHPALLSTPPLENLQRLVVITSPSTASASELVINGLKPFMPVVTVGSTTYGKPFGSVPRNHCGTVYSAIHFETLNSLGEGQYTSGLAPDCAVPDDLEHELGDRRERRLAAALGYIATGSCPAQAQSRALAPLRAAPAAPLGETVPPGMFAD